MAIELPLIVTSTTDVASYLTSTDADALAGQLPGLAAWSSAQSADKDKALRQASLDVDTAMRYQGRKHDADQELEFPRVASGSDADLAGGVRSALIWDWDDTAGKAVVPRNVLLAVVYQADSVLAGKRLRTLETQHDGLSSQGIGHIQESYRPGRPMKLCLHAYELLKGYALRTGRML